VPSPVVEIADLTKAYGGVRAVDGLSLSARPGEITAVLGPNGAGKTTTIECCEGLRRPDSGTVSVLGLDPAADSAELRSRVGVMLQDGGLPGAARAGDVLRHVAAMYAAPRDVAALARRLGIDAFGRTPVRRLSGGQRQRLALAAAVVGRPELVFLDEPSAGLDPQGRHAVWGLVGELRASGVAVILTTHLMDEAEALADDVAIVDHGRVIARGSPADLVADGPGASSGVRFTGPTGLVPAMARDLTPGVGLQEVRPGIYWASSDAQPQRADAGTSARLIEALATWAAAHGVLLTGFSAGPRTLEDVFLDLTGRELR
jgi:ABC-2 type transport system ATP-binding protein